MKIVTYNVNGLRQRVSQFGSLLKLLDSFDADIICFQETKLRRQELTADLAMADGYESFFSCTRTCKKGRVGYSGVATFCRVKSAFSSNEVALPAKAEEGFTGLLENSRDGKDEVSAMAEGLQEFPKDELLNVDTEGRCVITDHGHFVIFNVYGPRAEADDTDRIQFKRNFFEILQKRWESLMGQRRRIFVVGDLNIAPAAIDRCEAGPDFENNEFRKWLRSILVEQGGPFFDVFRAKHPERREAYTCWPSSTGAEQFNYGSRIDHILFAGSCLHQEDDQQCHNFVNCHVKECDILTQYKRLKPENATRWKGGWSFKLEGSDHVPVYTSLVEIPDVLQHNTPSLSSRYLPMIYGLQQTLVSVLMKRQVAKQVTSPEVSSLPLEGITVGSCSGGVKRSSNRCSLPCIAHDESCSSLGQDSEAVFSEISEESRGSTHEANCKASRSIESEHTSFMSRNETKKKARKGQWSQLSLRSFFQKSPDVSNGVDNYSTDVSASLADVSTPEHQSTETPVADDHNSNLKQSEMSSNLSSQNQDEPDGSYLEKEKNNVAVQEWQRIQQLMQNSIPLCRGHKEPCVARVVKKPGPTFGRRFYVCARAEGPSSNPEANCGYFRWASSKFREK